MNWLSNFVRPKIRALVKREVPENLWDKCPSCEAMLFHRDVSESWNVCHHCGYHLKLEIEDRLKLLFDDGKWEEAELPKTPHDPLKFKDRKRYADRLKESQAKTKRQDAIVVAAGRIHGEEAVVAIFDFNFMGGSMGMAVGDGIVAGAQWAKERKAGFIAVPSSGGARMQEGMLSLIQMPRTVIAVQEVKEAGLPYLLLLTNPTTGGVSASFAMLGDVQLAEPGATIGFAGKRVIQETIREDLPENFQTAEYLLEHGLVDMVVPRAEQKATIARLLGLLMRKQIETAPALEARKNKRNGQNGRKAASAGSAAEA